MGLCKDALQRVDSRPTPAPQVNENHNAKESSTPVQLHSSLTHSQGHILLKTAITQIRYGQTSLQLYKPIHSSTKRSEILYQCRITQQTSVSAYRERSGFGATNGNMRLLHTDTVYLQTQTETIPLNVLIAPKRDVPLRTYPIDTESRNTTM